MWHLLPNSTSNEIARAGPSTAPDLSLPIYIVAGRSLGIRLPKFSSLRSHPPYVTATFRYVRPCYVPGVVLPTITQLLVLLELVSSPKLCDPKCHWLKHSILPSSGKANYSIIQVMLEGKGKMLSCLPFCYPTSRRPQG